MSGNGEKCEVNKNDPRIKQLKIKTSVVRRIAKEKISYEKEAQGLEKKFEELCAKPDVEPIDKKKLKELVDESKMMIPDCQSRLNKALADLENIVTESDKELTGTEEYAEAKKQLEEMKSH